MPLADGEQITRDELQLAARNHGMPLEALRHDVTPLGLHYLLIHYDIPVVDPASWCLEVAGESELSLSLDDLRELPRATHTVTMECAGNGRALFEPRAISQPWLVEAVGTARWSGARVADVIARAGLPARAVEVLFTGLDRGVEGGVEQAYQRALPLDEALRDDVILAYEVNGVPLPPQHGFPLRLVVPGWYGMTNVKWLARIDVLTQPFDGYQQATAYRMRTDEDDPGEPVSRMVPRALMAPPGVPDFMTRRRFVEVGTHTLVGRAWSGTAPVEAVEVSVDGGRTWTAARLGEQEDTYSWRRWTFDWDATEPGEHELCCRARDAAGREQPLDAAWNLGGYANNSVQRVPVTVTQG